MTVLTNPADVTHRFFFNKVDKKSGYQAPESGVYSFYYDKDRRLTRQVFPSGTELVNSYANGRLVKTVTPEGDIDFLYSCGAKLATVSC